MNDDEFFTHGEWCTMKRFSFDTQFSSVNVYFFSYRPAVCHDSRRIRDCPLGLVVDNRLALLIFVVLGCVALA